jgi:hypothetical protein
MRTARRTIASIIGALLLSVVLAITASAHQVITYKGNTSGATPNRIRFSVLKRDDGQRFLRGPVEMRLQATCEDDSTVQIWWIISRARARLGEAGEFSWDFDARGTYLAMEGAIGFRNASGTAIGVTARLINDHTDSQVCTTGDLTWTAERTDTRPARLMAATTPDGAGSTNIRVSGGVAEVVKVIEP